MRRFMRISLSTSSWLWLRENACVKGLVSPKTRSIWLPTTRLASDTDSFTMMRRLPRRSLTLNGSVMRSPCSVRRADPCQHALVVGRTVQREVLEVGLAVELSAGRGAVGLLGDRPVVVRGLFIVVLFGRFGLVGVGPHRVTLVGVVFVVLLTVHRDGSFLPGGSAAVLGEV